MKTTNNNSIIEKVIATISEDQKMLQEQENVIEDAKEVKREIQSRLRDSKRDLATFIKYADDAQREKLLDMGLVLESQEGSLNKVAELAFDILQKSKDGEMTNGALYDAYVKEFKKPEDAFSYTDFNIKCRPLFNTQKLLRIEIAGKKSRDFIIRINGFKKKEEAPKKKAQPATPKKSNSKTSK